MIFKYLRNFYIGFGLLMSYAACIVGTKDYLKYTTPNEAMVNILPYFIIILISVGLAQHYHEKFKDFEREWF